MTVGGSIPPDPTMCVIMILTLTLTLTLVLGLGLGFGHERKTRDAIDENRRKGMKCDKRRWLPWRVLASTGPVLYSTHFFCGTMVLQKGTI